MAGVSGFCRLHSLHVPRSSHVIGVCAPFVVMQLACRIKKMFEFYFLCACDDVVCKVWCRLVKKCGRSREKTIYGVCCGHTFREVRIIIIIILTKTIGIQPVGLDP